MTRGTAMPQVRAKVQCAPDALKGSRSRWLIGGSVLLLMLESVWGSPQAGRRETMERIGASVILNVIVEPRSGQKEVQLTRDKLELYDAGIEQQIEAVQPDYSAARIALLLDVSDSLRAELGQLLQVVKAFAANLYEGDQMMLIAYGEDPEVLEEFTGDRGKLEQAGLRLKRTGSTKVRLWDALQATLDDALRLQVGYSKRIIVLVSDGFDRESQMRPEVVLANLARENVLVYVLQAEDRTRGATRRRTLKPEEAVARLVQGTGGKAYPLKDAERAAREILEELSERWYQVIYKPQGVNPLNRRRILLLANDPMLILRTKAEHPGEKN
ncbi:MAG: VWA domain-containing protein [Acidobacteriota bacterium]|nr:VWA domain-containing protein [Blastocatellia bacterium]MDW8167945.1 VWA domain-containing protein [Acidobacteriota bacterium]MDW8255970.1 VWA domain-containing protein [Acidobacteriota bacterium]